MLKILLIIINVLCTIYGVYFVSIVLLGALKKCPGSPPAPARKRIAAIICARNEARVIAGSVRTLLAQNYPRELFDVWVVPNNCTDDTAEAARAAGARVLDCTVPVKCKGDVLAFAFRELLAREHYDAFCIFDADNLVDPGFFQAANNALCAGVRVAQGYRDIKNPYESWVAGCMSVFFWFMSRFFNRGRHALGLSTMLNGTGIVLSADLIRENGWRTYSLTEDLEYTAQCGLLGEKIGWMEDAILYDEQPNRFADSFEQRRRWYAGTLQILGRYGPRLWARGIHRGSVQALDFAIFFTGALTQFLGLVPGLLTVNLVAGWLYGCGGWPLLVGAGLAILLGFCAVCSLGAWVMCRLVRRPAGRMRRAIALFGPFLISWLPANLFALIRRGGWKPIAHTSQAGLDQAAAAREETHDQR